jgi:hypothetical protein
MGNNKQVADFNMIAPSTVYTSNALPYPISLYQSVHMKYSLEAYSKVAYKMHVLDR